MSAPPSPERLVHDGRRARALAANPPAAGQEPAILWLSELWDRGEPRPLLHQQRQICSTNEGPVQAVLRAAQALMASDEADLVAAHFRGYLSSAAWSFPDDFEHRFLQWGDMVSQPVLYFVDRGGGSIGGAWKLGPHGREVATLSMARAHYDAAGPVLVAEDRALHAVTLLHKSGRGQRPAVSLKTAVKRGLLERFGTPPTPQRARAPIDEDEDEDDDEVHAQADAALRAALQAAGHALARDEGW